MKSEIESYFGLLPLLFKVRAGLPLKSVEATNLPEGN